MSHRKYDYIRLGGLDAMKQKISTTEMMYWRRCCKRTLMAKVRNEDIIQQMEIAKRLINVIESKQLMQYEHMCRMDEGRISQKLWNCQRPQSGKEEVL